MLKMLEVIVVLFHSHLGHMSKYYSNAMFLLNYVEICLPRGITEIVKAVILM